MKRLITSWLQLGGTEMVLVLNWLPLFILFIQSGIPDVGRKLPAFRVGLPSLVNPL